MSTAIPSHAECAPPSNGQFLLDLLREQGELTAVERFAQWHAEDAAPAQEKHYRDLIPLSPPKQGEQYAFEVDLDACSGCKSCVAACHNLNGLEEDEQWRGVGVLHGGTTSLPVIQHVTTACHHCIEPACLEGCPVNAYEKDPLTGIVRHLDDQCIGCQYCIFKCPYDVPRYSRDKGIVRKCDMCHDRLTGGEAPACVQSCPNQAIRIRVVNQQAVVDDSEANHFLPGAPEPGYTVPTTIYKTTRAMPRNLLAGDYYAAASQHSHLPLVMMLVLTQMSVGAFVVEQSLISLTSQARPWHLLAALLLGLLGLGAAVFHLGRPLYAYRAILGLRRSWLSREIVCFGLFAAAATAYVTAAFSSYWQVWTADTVETSLGAAAAVFGIGGVFCSIMIYVDTRRPFWNATQTSVKFLLTSLLLGIPTALLISLLAAAGSAELTMRGVMDEYGRRLCQILMIAVAAKLVFECSIFAHLRRRRHTPLKRTAMLMVGELGMTTLKRFFFGVVGGVILPLILLGEQALAPGGFDAMFLGIITALIVVLLSVGELLERSLFFAASVAPKMPGGLAT